MDPMFRLAPLWRHFTLMQRQFDPKTVAPCVDAGRSAGHEAAAETTRRPLSWPPKEQVWFCGLFSTILKSKSVVSP
jgi:hypothetical protein